MENEFKNLQDEVMNPEGIVLMKRLAANAKVQPLSDEFVDVHLELFGKDADDKANKND